MRHTISTAEAQAIRKARAKSAEQERQERKEREQRELDEHQSRMELKYRTQ